MSTDAHKVWSAPLVAACQTGNAHARRQAWTELVTQLQPTLQRFALMLVQNNRSVTLSPPQTAEDLVSETFVALYLNIHTLDAETRLMPWLNTVMRRKLIDAVRRNKARIRETFSIVDEINEVFDRSSDMFEARPEDYWVARLTIRRALGQLSSKHREVLWDFYWLGLKTSDIAAKRGLSVGTVKSRLHYAHKALKEIVEPTDQLMVA